MAFQVVVSRDKLPPVGLRVLLFDARPTIGCWRIATIGGENNDFWIVDPHIYYGVNHDHFPKWTELPENPQ